MLAMYVGQDVSKLFLFIPNYYHGISFILIVIKRSLLYCKCETIDENVFCS